MNHFKKKIKRSQVVTLAEVNKKFLVHNGRSLDEILVIKGIVGFKFGEFSFTRRRWKKNKKK